jgi:hypothetical protein
MRHSVASPFNDALEDLRISGSVLLHETYVPPWAIEIPAEADLQNVMGVGRDMRVVPFHLVRGGMFDLRYAGMDKTRVVKGEVAICPSGELHRMSFGSKTEALQLADILSG